MSSNQNFIGNGITILGASYSSSTTTTTTSPSSVVVAKFNMSSSANSVVGWVNVVGDPWTGVVTSSDNRSGTAIGFSTNVPGTTDGGYWNQAGSTCSAFVAAVGTGHVVESNSALYRGYFFTNGVNFNIAKPQVTISNLNPAKTYKFEILGSRQGASQGTRNSRIYCVDNVGTTDVIAVTGDYNGDYNFVFTGKVPTVGGTINLHVTQATVNTFGYLNLIKITQEN